MVDIFVSQFHPKVIKILFILVYLKQDCINILSDPSEGKSISYLKVRWIFSRRILTPFTGCVKRWEHLSVTNTEYLKTVEIRDFQLIFLRKSNGNIRLWTRGP